MKHRIHYEKFKYKNLILKLFLHRFHFNKEFLFLSNNTIKWNDIEFPEKKRKKEKEEREMSDSFSNSLCKREDWFFKFYYSKHLWFPNFLEKELFFNDY